MQDKKAFTKSFRCYVHLRDSSQGLSPNKPCEWVHFIIYVIITQICWLVNTFFDKSAFLLLKSYLFTLSA